MKLKYLLSALSFTTFLAYAQQTDNWCITSEKTVELWEKHPELKVAEEKYKSTILKKMNSPKEKSDDEKVYVIPIVFHVMHEYGKENISDEQIYSAVRILNEDFRKVNADTIDIVLPFKKIAADAKIEFKLATVDPYGNPTNGITRHYTNEVNFGDDYSKPEQWPRSRYLNIWTTKTVGSAGAAGYAFKPSGVEGNRRFLDGIMLNHEYIGDIGTGIPNRSRALTHEIGHYLGLDHTWGPTNDPGIACGDDGIPDTPVTRGWKQCTLSGNSCAPDTVVENVQNYMEYAYCSNMFTKDQVSYMRNVLNMETAQRNELWTDANIANSVPDGQVFNPVADFFVAETNKDRLITCVGEPIDFSNWSWRLSPVGDVSYTWTFQDGDITTSNEVNPTVSFTKPGWKTISLTVTQNGLSHTVTKEQFLWVSSDWAPFSGKVRFDFDDDPNYWIVLNPQNQPYKWKIRSDAGVNGSGAIFLDLATNPYEGQDVGPFTEEFFFESRRGGVKSTFVSQAINMSNMIDIRVSFDYACATNSTSSENMKEELYVYSSNNCGATWQLRKKIAGNNLVNNGSGWTSFYPNNTTIWTTDTLIIGGSGDNSKVFLKFEYVGSDESNNIAIDNINIDGVLGITDYQKDNNLSFYPNPSDQEKGWNIVYDAVIWGGADVQLLDMSGRVIKTGKLPKNQSEWNIKPTSNAAQGVYLLKVKNNEKVIQNKLILK